MKVGACFILLVGFLEEVVNPPLDQEAYFKRSMALSDSGAYKGKQGFWFREGRRFIRIHQIRYGESPQGLDIFEFNDAGQLDFYMHAQEAEIVNPQKWTLKNIKKQVIHGYRVSQEQMESLEWDSPLKQHEVRLLTLPSSTLAPSELYQYMEILKRKKQNFLRYELSFWDKIFMPLNTGLMILVAVPFCFRSLANVCSREEGIHWIPGRSGVLFDDGNFQACWNSVRSLSLLTTAAPFLLLSLVTFVLWRRHLN